jgi:AcrR family transcriptional regulator
VSTSPGLRERKKEQTRQDIGEAALRLFAERGFERVTVAEVASEANVSVATVFNYFPTKEDLVYGPMEAFEADLLAALRSREHGESILAAFRRVMLEPRGLLASKDPSARERLTTTSCIVDASPALLARENEIIARHTRALAALIAEETRAGSADFRPWVAANALMGVHRAMLDAVRRRVTTTAASVPRIASDVRSQAEHALALLEQGLGDYAIKSR